MNELHEKILQKMLEYKETHKDFTFYLRKQGQRLDQGYWFLGNENYINIPLFNRGDSDNKTQTIGFVYEKNNDRCFIEIVYKNVNNIDENEIEFYKELVDFLPYKEQKANDNRYWYIFKTNNMFENLNYYIKEFRNKCLELIKKYKLEDKYLISEEQFIKYMKRIDALKSYSQVIVDYKNKSKGVTTAVNNNLFNIKNIILYGAPGVGKTHNYQNLISMIENGDDEKNIFKVITNNKSNDVVKLDSDNAKYKNVKEESRVEFVTFHQSYSYEDFIEGFRPSEHGNIKLEDGIFKKLCSDAQKSDKNFYIVIDEINRGNISKIFGELITLIEEDKRDAYEVTLPYSKEKFKVPSNLYIIATMNSTDKSIATIDIALRRRFTFLKMKPNEILVPEIAKKLFSELNAFIKMNLGEDYMLGHSYFMKIENNEDLEFVKEYKIKPLLEEYFYADEKNYEKALGILETSKKKSDEDVGLSNDL